VKLLRNLDQVTDQLRGGAVSIGNFDGVHLGHARIIKKLIKRSKQVEGSSIVFTFEPHPVRILRPHQAPPSLTSIERKKELLEELGVDVMIAFPTDENFLQLSSHDFFEQILLKNLNAKAIVEGPNFFFGHDRLGNVDVMGQFCAAVNIQFEVVEPFVYNGQIVSSSRIRRAIASGNVADAAAMLTRPYRIHGTVVPGARRGAKLGFPTANIDKIDTIMPGPGIYAGQAIVENKSLPAAINIGPCPTFDENTHRIESHILDFDDDIYGANLRVDLLEQLREIKKFDNVDKMTEQLKLDVQRTREVLAHISKQGDQQ